MGQRLMSPRSLWTDGGADPDVWKRAGLCAQVDPEMWFPEKGGSTREAKRICGECPVRAECLEDALTHDERFGIWGGLSERERHALRRPVVASRAPHKHPGRSVNPVQFPCTCGCGGLVSKTTLHRHGVRARRLAERSVAA